MSVANLKTCIFYLLCSPIDKSRSQCHQSVLNLPSDAFQKRPSHDGEKNICMRYHPCSDASSEDDYYVICASYH